VKHLVAAYKSACDRALPGRSTLFAARIRTCVHKAAAGFVVALAFAMCAGGAFSGCVLQDIIICPVRTICVMIIHVMIVLKGQLLRHRVGLSCAQTDTRAITAEGGFVWPCSSGGRGAPPSPKSNSSSTAVLSHTVAGIDVSDINSSS
jgi:hypothetical protein